MIGFALILSLLQCFSARKEHPVYPVILEERSTGTNLVLRINDEITLNLEKSDVLAEDLLFVTATLGGHDVETVNTSRIQERIYHDKKERSSLMLQEKDGTLYVEGIVNRKLRIKPIPEGERSEQGHTLHSLYEVKEKGEREETMVAYGPYYRRSHVPQAIPAESAMANRRAVNKFVVELYIISDKEHNRNFASQEDLIGYLGVMVNAVTLRYEEMTWPKIAFKIVGVTMSKADVFIRHIHGAIEAHGTLEQLERYYLNGNIPGNPDVVYLITNREMSTFRGGNLDDGIAGLANVAGVCTRQGVAIGEDSAPSFEGAFIMAHELGHSLGARHDPRGYGQCSWRQGFLMSYEDGGRNKYRLSPCSMEAIRMNTAKLSDECIRESAAAVHGLPRPNAMPGHYVSPDEYCRLIMKKSLRHSRIRSEPYPTMPLDLTKNCKMKCCYDVHRRTWCRKVNLLDGMECGYGDTCRKGVCGRRE